MHKVKSSIRADVYSFAPMATVERMWKKPSEPVSRLSGIRRPGVTATVRRAHGADYAFGPAGDRDLERNERYRELWRRVEGGQTKVREAMCVRMR